jgi:glycosyl transferase, family 25
MSGVLERKSAKIPTLVVSLQSANERRADCEANLNQNSQIEWRFFDAMTASSPCAITSDPALQVRRFGRILTDNEIGCFKSHFCALNDFFRTTESDWLFVLEDDVWLDPNFDLFEVLQFAKANSIGYVRLFAKAYKPASVIAPLSGFRHVIRFHTDPYGTQAYLINRRLAAQFVSSLDRIAMPIDDELGRFWQHGLVPFAVFPFPVVEKSVPSQLEISRVSLTRDRIKYRPDLVIFRVGEKIKKMFCNLQLRLNPFGHAASI